MVSLGFGTDPADIDDPCIIEDMQIAYAFMELVRSQVATEALMTASFQARPPLRYAGLVHPNEQVVKDTLKWAHDVSDSVRIFEGFVITVTNNN